jgi:hypothetical protein
MNNNDGLSLVELRKWIAEYMPMFMRDCPVPHQSTDHADAYFRVEQFRKAILDHIDTLSVDSWWRQSAAPKEKD